MADLVVEFALLVVFGELVASVAVVKLATAVDAVPRPQSLSQFLFPSPSAPLSEPTRNRLTSRNRRQAETEWSVFVVVVQFEKQPKLIYRFGSRIWAKNRSPDPLTPLSVGLTWK